jgi:hypothetical protein
VKVGDVPVRKEVEFRVLREGWSKYEVIEGRALVWLRHILTKLFEIDVEKLPKGTAVAPGYIASTQTVVTAFFPEDLKGPPSKGPIAKDQLKGGQSIDFQAFDEPFNEYIIQGRSPQVIRAKAVATDIRWFPKKYNVWGDPIVEVDSQLNLSRPRKARPEELL